MTEAFTPLGLDYQECNPPMTIYIIKAISLPLSLFLPSLPLCLPPYLFLPSLPSLSPLSMPTSLSLSSLSLPLCFPPSLFADGLYLGRGRALYQLCECRRGRKKDLHTLSGRTRVLILSSACGIYSPVLPHCPQIQVRQTCVCVCVYTYFIFSSLWRALAYHSRVGSWLPPLDRCVLVGTLEALERKRIIFSPQMPLLFPQIRYWFIEELFSWR